jgi:hypothetical protein
MWDNIIAASSQRRIATANILNKTLVLLMIQKIK